MEPEGDAGTRITQRYEVVKLGPVMDRFIYQFVTVHRDRREALTADLAPDRRGGPRPGSRPDRVGSPSQYPRGDLHASFPIGSSGCARRAPRSPPRRSPPPTPASAQGEEAGRRSPCSSPTTTAWPRPGIDTLVEALRKVKNTKVVVVAPDDQPERHRRQDDARHAHHRGGDDRERLRGDRGAGLPGRHDHRRARPARREAERRDVGHQHRARTSVASPTCRARSAPRAMAATRGHPRAGVEPGLTGARHAAVRQRGEARGRRGWRSTAPTLAKKPERPRSRRSTTTTCRTARTGKPRGVKKVVIATTTDGAIADVDCAARGHQADHRHRGVQRRLGAPTKVSSDPGDARQLSASAGEHQLGEQLHRPHPARRSRCATARSRRAGCRRPRTRRARGG